jgi:hypothetical protein
MEDMINDVIRVRTGRFVSNYRLCPIFIGFPGPKYRPNIGFGSPRDQICGRWRGMPGHINSSFPEFLHLFILFLFQLQTVQIVKNQIHILCKRLTNTGKIFGVTLAASWASISI